jgi:hypothetical protein
VCSVPLCQWGVEDVKHVLFECPGAGIVWEHRGLSQMVKSACVSDRTGQAVLEYILSTEQHTMLTFGRESIPEIVADASWYLWWERRRAM